MLGILFYLKYLSISSSRSVFSFPILRVEGYINSEQLAQVLNMEI